MQAQTLLELAAAALAGWAAWLTVPRPPERDLERIFKVCLSTLLWAEAEAQGGGEAAVLERWDASLRALVPFHPAGRDPIAKLFSPSVADIAAPALDGERALVEALIALPSPAQRWQRMFVEDRAAADALTAHPDGLGAAGDPRAALGPDGGWEQVAAWGPSVQKSVQQRLSHVLFAVFGSPALAEALRAAAPGLRVHEAPLAEASLLALTQAPADRLVFLWAGAPLVQLLRALAEAPALIDRCLGLVQLGAPLTVDPSDEAWLAERWRHASFEPELQRSIPLLMLTDAGPDSPRDRWAAQLVPEPVLEAGAQPAIERISLGAAPLDALPPRLLARALLVTLALRLLAHE